MPLATCSACGEDVRLAKARLGQTLICVHCGAHLEVVEVDPVELDWAYDDEEDLEEEGAPDPLLTDDEADEGEDFAELVLDEEIMDDTALTVFVEDEEDMDDGEE